MVEIMEIQKGFKQTEVGVIPDDWEVKPINEITSMMTNGFVGTVKIHYTDFDNGILYIQGYNIEENSFNFNGIKRVTHDFHKLHLKSCLQAGDLLTIQTGDIGVTTVVPKKLEGSNCHALIITRFKKKSANSKFFSYYFNFSKGRNRLKEIETGSTMKHINVGDMIQLLIPLPTKTEQTAIANVLNDADALITQLEKLIFKKRAIKQGAMQELLKPKDGWEEKKLGEVATLKARIGWQGLTTAEYKKSGDFFLITGTEFKNGFIDWHSCFYVAEERYKQDKNIQVKEQDVLVTKDGTIGKIALIKSVPKPATLNSGVFVIRSINNSFNPGFFYYLLLSEIFLKFLSQLSASSTINHLYQKDFATFKFLIPKTIGDQKEIAQILSDMDTEINALEKKLSHNKLFCTIDCT